MERGVFRGKLDEEQCVVFQQILDGKTGREIAQSLQINPIDIEKIVRRTCRQLGVTSRMKAARTMAAHYRWETQPRLNEIDQRSGPGWQFAGERSHTTAIDRKTAKKQFNDISSLQDVGSHEAMRPSRNDVWGKFLDLFIIQSNKLASGHGRRLILIAIIVVGSTLALSALVSAMQGFDRLVSSWL
jgi:DNA-binding CsgD family transcriptional regulator